MTYITKNEIESIDACAKVYIEAYGERYAVASKWNELVWGEEHNIANKSAFIKHYLEGRIPYLDESLKLIEN